MLGSSNPLVQFKVEEAPTSSLSVSLSSWTGHVWILKAAIWVLFRTLILIFLAGSVIDLHLRPTIHPVSPYETVRPEARAKRLILIVCKDKPRASLYLSLCS